jgi:predicted amidohydrolase
LKVKVVGLQTQITENKELNLKKAVKLLDEAHQLYSEIDVVCLPELFYKIPSPDDAQEVAEVIPNNLTKIFSEKARNYGIYIVAGSFLEKKGDGRYNTSLLFGRNGEIKGFYSKTHLFNALNFKESLICKPGKNAEFSIFETDFGKIAITICYDLRFPEFYRTLALKGASIVFTPSAFMLPRVDHWNILVKAAALQNLIYVVAVNLVGKYRGFEFFGRSMIVDPWGVPLSTAPDKESIIYAELDLEYQKEIRKRLPIFEQRRPQLYKLED